jgi:ArsR family transcriptional regulator
LWLSVFGGLFFNGAAARSSRSVASFRMLEETGLVQSAKDGLWVNYSLTNGAASPYAAALLGNLRHWLEDEPEIRQAVGRLPFIDREVLCGRNRGNGNTL